MRLDSCKIRMLRNDLCLSQYKLADAIDCPRSLINKIETGKHKEVTLCTAYKLSVFFGVTIEYLIEK